MIRERGIRKDPQVERGKAMSLRKTPFFAGVLALGVGGALLAPVGSQAAGSAGSGRVMLGGTAAPSAERARPLGAVSTSSQVAFDLVLQLRDKSGAQALLRAVSTPGSAAYRRYLTAAQWEAQFSPSVAQVNQAESWLQSQGFKVGAVPSDRLVVLATGTASQVEAAFGTHLGNYQVAGHTLRLATSDLSVPASLSGIVAGTMGVNQSIAQPADVAAPSSSGATNGVSASSGQYPPPPPAFLPAPPCSTYFGQLTTTLSPPFAGYPTTVPDEVWVQAGPVAFSLWRQRGHPRWRRERGHRRRVRLGDNRQRRSDVRLQERPEPPLLDGALQADPQDAVHQRGALRRLVDRAGD